MSAEYTNNHYLPQWYQRQFIPAGQADRELNMLDLKPERFRDGNGVRKRPAAGRGCPRPPARGRSPYGSGFRKQVS